MNCAWDYFGRCRILVKASNHVAAILSAPDSFGWTLSWMVSFSASKFSVWLTRMMGWSGVLRRAASWASAPLSLGMYAYLGSLPLGITWARRTMTLGLVLRNSWIIDSWAAMILSMGFSS